MDNEFLTVRLSKDDSRTMQQLRDRTGLSKSDIVKQALRSLAEQSVENNAGGLFAIGAGRFGRYGNARRQSKNIKQIARTRARAKRTG